MPRKLRAPTQSERAAGLPRTKAEAVKQGITRFVPEDGVERIIRQYGSRKFPSGSIEKVPSRKANRGAGLRTQLAKASTPVGADKVEFGKAMAKAAAAGKEGHHITPLFLSGKAVLDMTTQRAAQYFERFKQAGVALGDVAENIMEVTQQEHRKIHQEGQALQRKLKTMEQRKPSFSKGGVKFGGYVSSDLSTGYEYKGGTRITTDPGIGSSIMIP